MASTARSTETSPNGNVLSDPRSDIIYKDGVTPNVNLKTDAIASAGTSSVEPHENRQPYLACYYIIALEGIYPPRS